MKGSGVMLHRVAGGSITTYTVERYHIRHPGVCKGNVASTRVAFELQVFTISLFAVTLLLIVFDLSDTPYYFSFMDHSKFQFRSKKDHEFIFNYVGAVGQQSFEVHRNSANRYDCLCELLQISV